MPWPRGPPAPKPSTQFTPVAKIGHMSKSGARTQKSRPVGALEPSLLGRRPQIVEKVSPGTTAGPRRTDRRVQRTLRTLREALIKLILERGWDNVSVQG